MSAPNGRREGCAKGVYGQTKKFGLAICLAAMINTAADMAVLVYVFVTEAKNATPRFYVQWQKTTFTREYWVCKAFPSVFEDADILYGFPACNVAVSQRRIIERPWWRANLKLASRAIHARRHLLRISGASGVKRVPSTKGRSIGESNRKAGGHRKGHTAEEWFPEEQRVAESLSTQGGDGAGFWERLREQPRECKSTEAPQLCEERWDSVSDSRILLKAVKEPHYES